MPNLVEVENDINLFKKDNSNDLNESINKAVKNISEASKNTQAALNNVTHQIAYENMRKSSASKEINKYFNIYNKKNIIETQFQKNFSKECLNRCFELIIVDFFDKKLKPVWTTRGSLGRDETQDFQFRFEDQKYNLECTTVSTSMIDCFLKFYPEIEIYISVWDIFKDSCEENEKCALWCFPNFENVWSRMEPGKKQKICNILIETNEHSCFKKLENVTYQSQTLYKSYPEVFDSLENCKPFRDLFDSSHHMLNLKFEPFKNIFFKKISQKFFEKMKKSYARKKSEHMIICISFSPIKDSLLTFVLDFENFAKNLILKNLKESYNSMNDKEKKNIELENIFFILIDMKYENWFNDRSEFSIIRNQKFSNNTQLMNKWSNFFNFFNESKIIDIEFNF